MKQTRSGDKVIILEGCKEITEILKIAARFYLHNPDLRTPETDALMKEIAEKNKQLIYENK